MLTVTPLPWLPSLRLDHHRQADFQRGGPGVVGVVDRAADAAPARRRRRSSFLVSSLSWAIDSAMALVVSISAAWMRRCLLPQPNWTRLPCGQAAVGNAARHGGVRRWSRWTGRGARPRRVRAARPARPSRSKGVSSSAARHSCCGQFEGQAADGFLGVFDDHLIDAGLDGVRGAAEGHRAAGLRLQAERGEFQRMGHRDGVELIGRDQVAEFGEAVAQAGFETGQVGDARTRHSAQVTMASMAVCRLHRLGPRRARMRETSMTLILAFPGSPACCRWRLLALCGSRAAGSGSSRPKVLTPVAITSWVRPSAQPAATAASTLAMVAGSFCRPMHRHVAEAAETDFVAAGWPA